MPFTPFHLGPALVLGIILLSIIDFPTFLIANIIVDLEPIIILLFNLDLPLHGFFHSFLGGLVLTLPLFITMSFIRKYLDPIMEIFKIKQKISYSKILFASILGSSLHILLDSMIYVDMKPFYPLNSNNLLFLFGPNTYTYIIVFCVLSFSLFFLIYIIKVIKSKKYGKESR
ncbi:MAG: hypothetical protein EU521_01155 [Promethearchaeota archaeon]|nr:MAG: hypothetical protein EU521_01155 [Candidatus Lokiarchaeota archaeon]